MTPKQKLWAGCVHAWLHRRDSKLNFDKLRSAEEFYDQNKKAIDSIFYEMRADLGVGVTRGMYNVLIWGIESYLMAEGFCKKDFKYEGFIKYEKPVDGSKGKKKP